jgi:hypothetical protein
MTMSDLFAVEVARWSDGYAGALLEPATDVTNSEE